MPMKTRVTVHSALDLVAIACGITLLVVAYAACNGSLRHVATGAATAITDPLLDLQKAADTAQSAGKLTVQRRQQIAKHLAPALVIARDLNQTILDWPVGAPIPQALVDESTNLQGLITDVAGAFNFDPMVAAAVSADIASALAALNALLILR